MSRVERNKQNYLRVNYGKSFLLVLFLIFIVFLYTQTFAYFLGLLAQIVLFAVLWFVGTQFLKSNTDYLEFFGKNAENWLESKNLIEFNYSEELEDESEGV